MTVKDIRTDATTDSGAQHDERPLKEVVFAEPDFFQNPYPVYARLRREAPVWWCEEHSAWLVSSYRGCRSVFMDPETYSNKPTEALYGPYNDPDAGSFFIKDRPEHTEWRRLFTGSGGFSVAAMKAFTDVTMRICTDAVAKLPPGGFDAVSDFAVPLTATFFGGYYNLSADACPWVKAMTTFYHPGTEELTPAMLKHFEELVQQRREAPGEDLLSKAVLANEKKGRLLNDAQMAWNFHDLLLAGASSLYIAIAESVAVLAENPEGQDLRYWDSPEAAKRSTEEILRCLSHSHWLYRTATKDVELGGQLIRAGDVVCPINASASRDEAIYGPNSEKVDFDRVPEAPNFAFGYGPHISVGASMSRVFLATLLPIVIRARAPFRPGEFERMVTTSGVGVPLSLPIVSATGS